MKKFLNVFFKKFIYNLNYKVFMKNYILLESNPDYADNTYGVFNELISRNYNKNYKIIWFVDDKDKFNDLVFHNVKFITRNGKIYSKVRFAYYNFISKIIIDCNKCIKKRNKNQFRIHLTHGAPLKLATDYCNNVGKFDYLIQLSDFFTNIHTKLFLTNAEKIISTGFPRNDFILKKCDIQIFEDVKRNKTVYWFPTYRNHKLIKNNDKFNMNIHFPFGVPVITSKNELVKLNSFLYDNNILLVIKLHPAEDASKISEFDFSNIKLLNDSFFEKDHTNLYQLLSNSDGLITDYSSVYYDYLLKNKPIGLAIPDIDEYQKHVSLLFDNFEENVVGEYIYNFDDLMNYFINLSNDNDITKVERGIALKKYHAYADSDSSKRVVDLLDSFIYGKRV